MWKLSKCWLPYTMFTFSKIRCKLHLRCSGTQKCNQKKAVDQWLIQDFLQKWPIFCKLHFTNLGPSGEVFHIKRLSPVSFVLAWWYLQLNLCTLVVIFNMNYQSFSDCQAASVRIEGPVRSMKVNSLYSRNRPVISQPRQIRICVKPIVQMFKTNSLLLSFSFLVDINFGFKLSFCIAFGVKYIAETPVLFFIWSFSVPRNAASVPINTCQENEEKKIKKILKI